MRILYPYVDGLAVADPVLWHGQKIGEVRRIEDYGRGPIAVTVAIDRDYRAQITKQSRFLLQYDPGRPGRKAVQMIQLAEAGEPLPAGAEIPGSTEFSLKLEQSRHEFNSLLGQLMDEIVNWQQQIQAIPVEEWYRQFQQELEQWLTELKRAGEVTRRRFRREILPRLEKIWKDLQNRLRQQGRSKEVEIIEVQMKELRQI
ncbi:MAG: hypothetical protein JRJ12_08020 [Deltaproteobacteria bacterium]|nr:hypothetical protein [Deltaproteobacteria bacterium]MBW2071405.1 hypothetical protein [Deltaproteobacteria bacterium]